MGSVSSIGIWYFGSGCGRKLVPKTSSSRFEKTSSLLWSGMVSPIRITKRDCSPNRDCPEVIPWWIPTEASIDSYGPNNLRLARSSSAKFALFLRLTLTLAPKVGLDFCSACLSRPVGRGSLPEDILQIQSCTAFDEQSDQFVMAGPSGLMQRCRMGMAPDRVVSVWIFA